MNCSLVSEQTCYICHKELEENTLNSTQSNENTKSKMLKCGHVFHQICINRFFYDQNTSCPNCGTEISKSDRFFNLSKDSSASPNQPPSYIALSEKGLINIVLPGNMSEEDRDSFSKIIYDIIQKTNQ